MSDQIVMPRALSATGEIVPGALARFYTTGTSSPLSVYADTALSVVHLTPLEADSEGVFPQVFTASGTAVKLEITDPDTGVSLPGYPQDPAYLSTTSSGAAAGVTFSPITGNAATDVQTAIANNTSRHEGRSTAVKSLLDGADAAEMRTTLSLGAASLLGLASQAEAEAGTATSALMNPLRTSQAINALMASDFSLSQSGYADLAFGLQIRWGRVSSTADTAESFSFAKAFSSDCHGVIAMGRSGAGSERAFATSAESASGFTLVRDASIDGTVSVFYFALGR